MKQKLVKCAPRAYSELIRSNIPRSSGSKSSRPPALRPSPPSVMKSRHEGPLVVKPTREELRARVEALSRRRRSENLRPHQRGAVRIGLRPRGWGHPLHHPSLKFG